MRYATVRDEVVQNIIEINQIYKAGYEHATQTKLIELDEDMNVQPGDLYVYLGQDHGYTFLRDGIEVSKDNTIKQLKSTNKELKEKITVLEATNNELTEQNKMLTACVLEMSELIYA